jgi:ATP/maltotriose-dependent transcriptional regulator MalT
VRDASARGRGPHHTGMPVGGLGALISTKLRPSQAYPRLVARPRLVDRMVPDASRRLTLVSAPAGSGKTTLLRSFVQHREDESRLVAWLALDAGDNDLGRFLSYLVGALRTGGADETVGHGLLGALRTTELPATETLTRALVTEVNRIARLDLVLDDYQVIDNPDVHQVVVALLDHAAPDVHLVISSRTDPPLPLPRLRAVGQLLVLGADDLAFTSSEATAFLRGVMELDLTRQDIATLEGRTEGWVAGLQLAALSMRGRGDLTKFIESFSGMHRDVLDYLGEEVLHGQPADVRRFLLSTSILDQLTGPLCDAVTGRTGGSLMLELLERNNVFVVALDDERIWYRYHHLFAEFLRSRLHRDLPGQADELHRRAAGWYEANGHPDEAVRHAVAAADFELATRVIRAEAGQAWSRGEVPTVLRWLEALPASVK